MYKKGLFVILTFFFSYSSQANITATFHIIKDSSYGFTISNENDTDLYILKSEHYNYSLLVPDKFYTERGKHDIVNFGYAYGDLDAVEHGYIIIPKKSKRTFWGIWDGNDIPSEFELVIWCFYYDTPLKPLSKLSKKKQKQLRQHWNKPLYILCTKEA